MVQMGQIQKSTMETRFVGICKGMMVARRPGTADSRLEPNRKKVMDAMEDYLENCAQVKVETEVVESLLRPENAEVSQKVHPEAFNKTRQQHLPAL